MSERDDDPNPGAVLLIVFLVLALVILAGIAVINALRLGVEERRGTNDGYCYPNHTCNPGLICVRIGERYTRCAKAEEVRVGANVDGGAQ